MAVTWNPLDKGSAVTLSNGDLTWSTPSYTNGSVRATKGVSSGKWYWEIKCVAGNAWLIGIGNINAKLTTASISDGNARLYYQTGGKYPGGGAYGEKMVINDTIGVALDMDSGTIGFYRNGVYQGIAFTDVLTCGTTIYPYQTCGTASIHSVTANFGATAFVYPIPYGYTALDSGTPTTIDITVTSIKATTTGQAINPIVSTSKNTSFTLLVSSANAQAIIPTVIADSTTGININGVLATSSSEMRIPTITSEIVLDATIEVLRSDSTYKFIEPLISAIRNEIARLSLSELVRKPIIEIKDRTIINTEKIRNIRTEVI